MNARIRSLHGEGEVAHKNTRWLRLLGGALMACAAAVAQAIPISGSSGVEGLGSWTGDLTYTAVDATHGTLTIQMANTSPAANGGYITALAFNNPYDWITGFSSFTSTDGDFAASPLCSNCVSGSPYGNFDFLISTGGGFLGSGSPTGGIKPGALGGGTETFTYSLTGTNMAALTSNDFLKELSSGGDPKSFVVRFRGFNNGGSDKVPVDLPEPGTLGVLALGLGFLAWQRRQALGR